MNRTEIRVIGMSRSGNHCIINWMRKQIGGKVCFLNCAEGGTNPFLTARPMDDGRSVRVNYRDFDLERERRGVFSRKDWLVHSYEDSFLGRVCGPRFERDHDRFVGRSARRVDVLVLRDPYNLFASRRLLGLGLPGAGLRRMWKQHARECLARRYTRRERLVVSYNAWVTCRHYRRRIAVRLGFPFTDAGVDEVPACAGGSSFDGLRFDGKARRMPVLRRWHRFADDPDYRRCFDPETVELARHIFGACLKGRLSPS